MKKFLKFRHFSSIKEKILKERLNRNLETQSYTL